MTDKRYNHPVKWLSIRGQKPCRREPETCTFIPNSLSLFPESICQ